MGFLGRTNDIISPVTLCSQPASRGTAVNSITGVFLTDQKLLSVFMCYGARPGQTIRMSAVLGCSSCSGIQTLSVLSFVPISGDGRDVSGTHSGRE